MFLFPSDPLLVVLVARMGTFGSIINQGLAGNWGRTSTPDRSFRRPQPPNILVSHRIGSGRPHSLRSISNGERVGRQGILLVRGVATRNSFSASTGARGTLRGFT